MEMKLFYEMDRFYTALMSNTLCLQGYPLQTFHLETILRINKSKIFY